MEFDNARWIKSTRSSGSGSSDCVEVARTPEVVGVRDSKNPTAATLVFTRGEWTSFLAVIKDGGFDR
jgi:hypothetical protein